MARLIAVPFAGGKEKIKVVESVTPIRVIDPDLFSSIVVVDRVELLRFAWPNIGDECKDRRYPLVQRIPKYNY